MLLPLTQEEMARLRAFLDADPDCEALSEHEYVADLYDIAAPMSLDLVFPQGWRARGRRLPARVRRRDGGLLHRRTRGRSGTRARRPSRGCRAGKRWMSASRERIRHVYAATRDLLDALHPARAMRGCGASAGASSRPPLCSSPARMCWRTWICPRRTRCCSASSLASPAIPGWSALGVRRGWTRSARPAGYLKGCSSGAPLSTFTCSRSTPRAACSPACSLQRGTTDSAPFYVRHVLGEVVRTHAHAIVISHNHPNNTLLPSQDDVGCTLSLITALQPLGVPLLDHVVVADQQAVSIRDLGYIGSNIWLAQAPGNALLSGWLKDAPPL